MFSLKTFVAALIVATVASVQAVPVPQGAPGDGPVFTATRVYETITDVPPYFITLTTTFVWTAGPTTSIDHPTGTGLPPPPPSPSA